MRSKFVVRARILCALFILGAAFITFRLYFMQVVKGDEYRGQAVNQYVESSPDALHRGAIFFTDKLGEMPAAAVMQTGWRITIRPSDITDAEAVYEKLVQITPIDRERFFTSAAKLKDPYEEVAYRLSEEEAQAVRALKIPGVLTVQDRWRVYPGGKIAANVLGFVGFQGDTRSGRYGIERYWEDTLTRSGSGLYVNPFAELFINVRGLLSSEPSRYEGDVVTSIEPTVQRELEEILDGVIADYSPKEVGAIVMDPKTGNVIAMAMRPTFDPNTFNTAPNTAVYANPLVENVYEMGSIMKPLTVAAGIDAGSITSNTTYNDKGSIMKSGKKISNFDGKGRGVVSMQEVLNQSLNTGVSFIVDRMGNQKFADYVHAFGLGEETGIDLPNEVRGRIGSIDNGSDVDYASASFGQGIAVTPIAMTRALSALANGGVLPEPHVVRAIRYESGITRAVTPNEGTRVIKQESAEETTRMLVKVYDTALLNGALKQEHYSIAAKTGTAQIARQGGGGYYEDRYLHSFFGYLPAHDAKFIVFLYTLEPHGVRYASETLAHPFDDVAKFLINYYQLPPDR